MKKIFLGFTLLLFTVAGFSQSNKKSVIQQNKPVKIDSLVTVSLPVLYQQKDTLGQRMFLANSPYGFITVIRAPNEKNNTPLKKEKDLNKVFQDYIQKIKAQSAGGETLHIRDTTVGTLKAKTFTLKTDDESGNVQLINFTLIYTQDATYTFEYVYPQMRADLVNDEYKGFISSIRLSPELQRNDQYLYKDKGMSSTTQIAIIGGGGVLVILLIVFVVKRKNGLSIG